MIKFVCTSCKRNLLMPDNAAGKKAICPQCKSIIMVPAQSEVPSPTTPEVPGIYEFNDGSETKPPDPIVPPAVENEEEFDMDQLAETSEVNAPSKDSSSTKSARDKTVVETIRQIREILATEGDFDANYLTELADLYHGACKDVIDRSHACKSFIEKGSRDEAFKAARKYPDLKEEFEQVTFIEAPAWLELCERSGLPVAPAIDADEIGSIIQDIYSKSDKTAKLMAMHRKLAIGRGPLVERIKIMRQLRILRKQEKFWEDDIRTFEREYLEQLAGIIEKADNHNDLRTLESTLQELTSSEWLEKPTQKFINAVQTVIVPHRKREADKRYLALSNKILAANSAMDAVKCRQLLVEWDAIGNETKSRPPEKLSQQVEPVRAWLFDMDKTQKEDEAFKVACSALELAIDKNEAPAELEIYAGKILKFERGMPELLEVRLNSRLKDIKKASTRKYVIKMTVIVGSIFIVAAGAVFGFVWHSQQQEFKDWEGKITKSFDGKDYKGASNLIDTIKKDKPKIYNNSPKVKEIEAKCTEIYTLEIKLKKDFNDKIKDVEIAWAKLPEKPSKQDIAALKDLSNKFAEANGIISRMISELGTAGSYSQDAKGIAEVWRQKLSGRQEDISAVVKKECEKLTDEFDVKAKQVEQAISNGQANYKELATAFFDMAKELDRNTDMPANLKTKISETEKRIQDIVKNKEAAAEQMSKIEKDLDVVAENYNNPASLANLLRSFAKNYPDNKVASQFAQSAEMESQWKSAVEWGNLARKIQGKIRSVKDVKEVDELVSQIDEYASKYPGGVNIDALGAVKEYLQVVKKSYPNGELTNLVNIKKFLDKPFMSASLMLQNEGKTYYILESDKDNTKRNVVALIFKGLKSTSETADMQIKLKESDPSPSLVAAPQKSFAIAAKEMIGKIGEAKWQTLYLRLADLAVKSKAVDPILSANMVQLFFALAKECSPFEQKALDSLLGTFKDINIDVSWMDPEDKAANEVRPVAKRLIETINSGDNIKKVIDTIDSACLAIGTKLPIYKPVGIFLTGSTDLQFKVQMENGNLYIITKNGNSSVVVEIGKIVNKEFKLNTSSAGKITAGTPVYVQE